MKSKAFFTSLLKNKFTYVFLVITVLFIVLLFTGDTSISKLRKVNKESKFLDVVNDSLIDMNIKDSVEIELLENDTAYQEKVARELHQMKKEGEDVYIVN